MDSGPFKNAEGGWGLKTINASFSFRPPKNTHTNNFWGYKKVFRSPPKHTLVNISWNLALSVLQFWGV